MGYSPKTIINSCPGCGGMPHLIRRGWCALRVRLECPCGVAGQWRWPAEYDSNWHNVAASGWEAVAGEFKCSPSPLPVPK